MDTKVAWVPRRGSFTEAGIDSVGGHFVDKGKKYSETQAHTIAFNLNHQTKGIGGVYITVYCA